MFELVTVVYFADFVVFPLHVSCKHKMIMITLIYHCNDHWSFKKSTANMGSKSSVIIVTEITIFLIMLY